MNIKLKKIIIENFKGIKEQTINFDNETKIFADNGVGKTTIYDAYLWLLFDKDSMNSSIFDIKPIDPETEKEIHNLVTKVEAELEIDGQELKLKKEWFEKYKTKKGSATEEFDSHKTDYYWNNVPLKKYEFNDNLGSIIQEDKFKILSNPRYFAAELKEKDRREMLVDLIEGISDKDILSRRSDLKDLEEELSSHTVEELQKINKSSLTKLKKDLEEIPNRIDENFKQINNELDFEALRKEKAETQNTIKALTSKPETGKETIEKNKALNNELAKIESRIREVRHQEAEKQEKNINKARSYLRLAKDNQEELQQALKITITFDSELKEKISNQEKRIVDLREEWTTKAKENQIHETNCPTCQQPLPPEKIKETIKMFEEQKEKKLAQIQEEGVKAKLLIEKLRSDIEENSKNQTQIKEKLEQVEKDIEQAEEEFQKASQIKIEINPEIERLTEQKEQIEKELLGFEEEIKEDNSEIENKLKERITEIERELAQEELNSRADNRIKELEKELKEKNLIFEETQKKLYLLEEFSKEKMSLISNKIDSKFKYVKWKLFEEQLNGGIKEVCKATHKGVPYESLSNAQRIKAGLDIIETLSNHLDVKVPVFVDNAESITEIPNSENQIIELIVEKGTKKLRIEGAKND